MSSLFDFITNNYRLTTAQQIWLLTNMRAAATAACHPPSVRQLDTAMLTVSEADRIELQYNTARARQADALDASEHGRAANQLVAALHSVLTLRVETGVGPGETRFVEELLVKAFPDGLRMHVLAKHVELENYNRRLLAVMTATEHQEFMSLMGITPTLTRLAELNAAFIRDRAFQSDVTWDQLQAARRLAGEAVLQAVLAIAATFPVTAPAEVAVRDAILLPYQELMNGIGAEKRAVSAAAGRAKAKAAAAAAAAAAGKPTLPLGTPIEGIGAPVADTALVPVGTWTLPSSPSAAGVLAVRESIEAK